MGYRQITKQDNARILALRHERLAAGRCVGCDGPSDGHWLCPKCREYQQELRKRRELIRVHEKICVSCLKPNPEPGKRRCPACRQKATEKAKAYYYRKKAEMAASA